MDLDRRMFVGAGAALAAAGSAGAARANVRALGADRAKTSALGALQDYVEAHRTGWGLPGMTFCVVDRAGFSGFITNGWADVERRIPVRAEHQFHIGSITKMMTALAIHSLAAEAKLSLGARLGDLIPSLAIAGGDAITVQHLLDHIAGLPGNAPPFPEGGLWVGSAPGSHWSYSNTAYHLLGLIAANADGCTLPECLEARVLRPLGMNASAGGIRLADRARHAQGYEPSRLDRPVFTPTPLTPAPWIESDDGAGCVTATADDMAMFLRFLLGLAEGKGGGVLSNDAARAFLANPADAPGWAEGATYGNGIAHVTVEGVRYLHHTGGMVSFASSLHVDPQAGVAAFASSNVSHTLNYRPREITRHACRVFAALQRGEHIPDAPLVRAALPNPGRFAGMYRSAAGESFEVRADAGAPMLIRNGAATPMQALGGSAFACRDDRFAVTGLVFDLEEERGQRAWAGEEEFIAAHLSTYLPPAPAELRALAGRYDNDNPWEGKVYVYARAGGLWLNNIEPLTALGGGLWRIGADDWSPERARFTAMHGGRPMQMVISGTSFVRRFS